MVSKFGCGPIHTTVTAMTLVYILGKRKDGNLQMGLSRKVVEDLTERLNGTFTHVYCDNYFYSPALCKSLLEKKDEILVSVWHKKKGRKPVLMVLTNSNQVQGSTFINRRQKDGLIKEVPSVLPVLMYNEFMNAVDHSDQLRILQPTARSTRRWWVYIMWFLFDISLANAFICFKESPNNARINKNGKEATVGVLSFKKAIVKYLLEGQNYRKRKATNGGLSDHGHWPKKTTSARRFDLPGTDALSPAYDEHSNSGTVVICKDKSFPKKTSSQTSAELSQNTPRNKNHRRLLKSKELWSRLHGDLNIRVLVTRQLNQDPLENFFGSIRQQRENSDNPTPIQFKRAYRKLFHTNLLSVASANCEVAENKLLTELADIQNIPDLAPVDVGSLKIVTSYYSSFNSFIPEGKSVTCLEDLGSLTVKELKNILLPYNEKVSGNKADLILCTYAVFSRTKRASTNEAGKVMLDKDNPSCTYNEIYASMCDHLPWVAKDGDFTFIDVRMKASMKNILYKVLVILDSSGNVSSAACTCPAGSGLGGFGNCIHVGGVLFALEDFNRKGYHQCTDPVSCTSKLSAWNVPSSYASKSVSALPIDEMILTKIKFGKDNDKSFKPRSNLFDPRLPEDKEIDAKNLQQLAANLAIHSPNSCFFRFP
eukprot:gene3910-15230_t